jgi:chitinase
VDNHIRVDGEDGCLNAFKKLKGENPHLKVIVSFGGTSGSSAFPMLAAEEGSRRTFAMAARDFVDEYGFDGVDGTFVHVSTYVKRSDMHRFKVKTS